MEDFIKEDIELIKGIFPRLHRTYRNALQEIIDEIEKRKCIYTEIEDNVWQCSNCKTKWLKEEESPKDFNYCPKCGYRIEFKEGN